MECKTPCQGEESPEDVRSGRGSCTHSSNQERDTMSGDSQESKGDIMTPQTPEMHSVLERLEKLERTFSEMAQERATFRIVEANAFVLKDSEGRVRAVLQMESLPPETWLEREESKEPKAALTLLDDKGQPRAQLREGVLTVGEGNDHCAKLAALENSGTSLTLAEGPANERSIACLAALKDGPQILVQDAEGNKTVIGNLFAGSELGPMRIPYEALKNSFDKRDSGQFSAMSIVMVARKGKNAFIWRAP